MEVVGARMKTRRVLHPRGAAQRAHHAGLPRPRSSRTSPPASRRRQGTVVIGTVEGDLHDIGKNLVGMMLQGAGFDGRQPGHRRHAGRLRRGRQGAQAADPRHERPAHHHPAQDGRDHRSAQGRRPARPGQGHGRRRPGHARPSPTRSAPTATAPTPAWRSRSARHSFQ